MIVKVKYTIETEYNFSNEQQLLTFPDEDETVEQWIENWIKEDFYKIENRADNVLPLYTSKLEFDFDEEEK